MTRILARMTTLVLTAFLVSQGFAKETNDWPGFRGPGGRGIATEKKTAESWDVTDPSDAAVVWNVAVPGLGHSSPTIIGNKIFLATAVPASGDAPLNVGRNGDIQAADDNGEQTWWVLCYEKTTGKELWRKAAHTGSPKATRHAKATHANSTIAADADHVVAFFGSEGLYCYDHDGNLLWQRDFGVIDVSKYDIGWGYASSPAIHGNQIVLVCDAPDDPYVVSLRLSDGEELWRKSRQGDCERSWGTALIHQGDDGTQVVVNGWPWIVSYDLENGEEVWRIEGGGDNPTPTPFVNEGRIYITNSHGGPSPIYAISTSARGNLSDSDPDHRVVWKVDRGGSYMATPVVWGDYLYLGNTNGLVRCFDAETGEKIYEERLGSGASITASLVAADDKVYCPSEDGKVYVVQAGPEFKILAKNEMNHPCFATPAISGGVLYVRTTETLVAIEPNSETTSEASSTDRPNVLFIAVDDLRPSMGCYGDLDAITPHMDALAARGVKFNRAYCQVAVCNPSRASLMTGLCPDNLGVWTLPIHFREAKPDAVTLPQWFRKFGYTAVSHGKIYHNPTPDPQSWSEPIRDLPSLPSAYPDGTRETVQAAMKELPANDWRKNNLRSPSTASPDLPDNQLLDGARTDMAIEDLRRLGKQDEPFFLAMGYIRPHLAWVAPKKYWDMHDPSKLPVLENQHVIPNTPPYAPTNNSELSHYVDLIDMPKPWDESELSIEQRRQLIHGYYACVSYVDAQIGRLLDALEDEGLADKTIVVLWSDHGWKLGESRGWGKMTNYEIDARVPLIIAGPNLPAAGQSTDQLAELLDLYPTLCEMAGLETPSFTDGNSLVPILNDAVASVRESATSQYYRSFNGGQYMGYSMRTDEYRFIEWRDFETGLVTDRELYDHRSGDVESENIATTAPKELVDQLTKQLLQSHPRKGLVMTPAIHSDPSPGRWPAELQLNNQTETTLMAFPITPTGRRGRVTRIEPGKAATFNARIGGVYVVESIDGTVHEVHSPSYPPRQVVID
ncbi:Choline-sulfatase [Rubripirellula tenax]|uniref:Choline-sulfatase n=1 Tax=Rubripirellula tenax TaxID=2528015 RepID=A0A5C6F501_9BACT|nr:sulfatase-like hydrolase/transferase [Rubripirellula tenax]TWU54531.1 Choline-sulfatase [Rubripirellula tenax]